MADCLIGLGSNIGNRGAHIGAAIECICGNPQIKLRSASTYHETAPIGGPSGQDSFLNAALRVNTRLSPREVLAVLRDVERQLGRKRLVRWGPRNIDIDLLLYDQAIVETQELTVPHPRMAVRRFVLQGASEIAADMIHAPTGWSIELLLKRLDLPPNYVAIASSGDPLATDLAQRLGSTAKDAHIILESSCQVEVPSLRSVAPRSGAAGVVHRPSIQMEHQRLANRLDCLAAIEQQTRHDPTRLIVSDFWLSESLAIARAWFGEPERQYFVKACQAAIARIPVPRFVLFADPSVGRPRPVAEAIGAPTQQCDSARARLDYEMSIQAISPGQGPILRVTASDAETTFSELVAAIDAMR